MTPSKVSVILTTYEEPAWLELVLWAYAVQSRRDFEIVVGDDGSGPETAAVIDRLRAATDLDVRHLWQPDRGFRKSTILNKAILAARGDYLIFSDGDCVPRGDFVATHLALARRGRFLSGGALRMPLETSRAIAIDDVVRGDAFRAGWLKARGWRPGRRAVRLTRNAALAGILDRVTPTRPSWNGGNASTWREHVVAANGFEEEMRYKGQDRAFGERLENLGVGGLQVRHRAVLLHLEHDRPYADPAGIARNAEIRARIAVGGETRAVHGLAERAAAPAEAGDVER